MKKLTIETAEELASKMRTTLRVGAYEPLNMKTTLRQLNILTIYRPLSEDLWGLSLKSNDDKRFMLINSNATRGSQHFTIAHELYHLYFDSNPHPHFCTQNQYKDSAERSANMFASALLMPKEGLTYNISSEDLINKKISIDTALKLEQLYGVSHSTLVVRLKELRLISSNNADELMNVSIRREAIQRGLDLSLYYKGNEGLILGDYGIKAKKLFDEEKISEGHYNELLKKIRYGESEDCVGC